MQNWGGARLPVNRPFVLLLVLVLVLDSSSWFRGRGRERGRGRLGSRFRCAIRKTVGTTLEPQRVGQASCLFGADGLWLHDPSPKAVLRPGEARTESRVTLEK